VTFSLLLLFALPAGSLDGPELTIRIKCNRVAQWHTSRRHHPQGGLRQSHPFALASRKGWARGSSIRRSPMSSSYSAGKPPWGMGAERSPHNPPRPARYKAAGSRAVTSLTIKAGDIIRYPPRRTAPVFPRFRHADHMHAGKSRSAQSKSLKTAAPNTCQTCVSPVSCFELNKLHYSGDA
jgi:hypothetical protein